MQKEIAVKVKRSFWGIVIRLAPTSPAITSCKYSWNISTVAGAGSGNVASCVLLNLQLGNDVLFRPQETHSQQDHVTLVNLKQVVKK